MKIGAHTIINYQLKKLLSALSFSETVLQDILGKNAQPNTHLFTLFNRIITCCRPTHNVSNPQYLIKLPLLLATLYQWSINNQTRDIIPPLDVSYPIDYQWQQISPLLLRHHQSIVSKKRIEVIYTLANNTIPYPTELTFIVTWHLSLVLTHSNPQFMKAPPINLLTLLLAAYLKSSNPSPSMRQTVTSRYIDFLRALSDYWQPTEQVNLQHSSLNTHY